MESFLNKKIDGEEFCYQIFGLHSKLIDRREKFELELISGSEKSESFQPDERAKKFSSFLNTFYISGFLMNVYCECDYFMENYENDEFYNSIKDHFLKFEKALNEG